MRARTRPNGTVATHDFCEADLRGGDARCPYCDGPVTRKKYREIIARIEAEGRERIQSVEAELKARFAQGQQQAVAKAKAEVAAAVAKAKQDAAAALTGRVAEAVNKEKQRSYSEKLAVTAQLEDMRRRLEKRSIDEIGMGAEGDLHTILVEEFGKYGDRLERAKRGQPGAT